MRAPRPRAHAAQHILTQQWAGPLPPPAILEHFNQIISNGADRLMKIVEEEQAHRAALERQCVHAEIADFRRGHWLGAGVSIAAIAGSVFTSLHHTPALVSISLVSVPVLGMVQAFLHSRKQAM